jgi:hypothetical protein
VKNKQFATILMAILTVFVTVVSLGCLLYSAETSTDLTRGLQAFSLFSGMAAAGCLWVLSMMILALFDKGENE